MIVCDLCMCLVLFLSDGCAFGNVSFVGRAVVEDVEKRFRTALLVFDKGTVSRVLKGGVIRPRKELGDRRLNTFRSCDNNLRSESLETW